MAKSRSWAVVTAVVEFDTPKGYESFRQYIEQTGQKDCDVLQELCRKRRLTLEQINTCQRWGTEGITGPYDE